MRFIPILYSTPMVKAIRNGSKDRTRRVVKQAEGYDYNWEVMAVVEEYVDGIQRFEMRSGTQYSLPCFKCPYGQIGDVLWVRETFTNDVGCNEGIDYLYKADCPDDQIADTKWKPNIFMPKKACRTFLQITNITSERLNKISEQDAILEGIDFEGEGFGKFYKNYDSAFRFYEYEFASPVDSFESLWVKINGKASWDKNPFVWVIEFKVIEKPENFI